MKDDIKKLREALGLDDSIEDIFKRDTKDIPIGTYLDSQGRAYLNLDLLRTHVHVVGRTGTGKTRFLALLARQILDSGRGGCVIDIQGGLYHLLENYIANDPELAKRVIYLNPGEAQDPIAGFNPLAITDYLADPQSRVDMMIEAMKKHMKQADEVMPTFKKVTSYVLPALMYGNHTILEGEFFANWIKTGPRDVILKNVPENVKNYWFNFDDQTKHDKKQDILAFDNRINEFIHYRMLRCTLGRTTNLIDFKDIVDNDKFLLVNLRYPTHLSFDAATLIGINVINELFYYAMSRSIDEADKHPFTLIIDEMQNFITPDLVRILDMCRQKGLHLILAHQRLNQLKKVDPELYSAVNSNALTKIIFSVPMEDAKILADEIFDYDLQEIKHQLRTISVIDYIVEYLMGKSATKGITKTIGKTWAAGGSATRSMGGSDQTLRTDATTWPGTGALFSLDPLTRIDSQGISHANFNMQSYGDFDMTSDMESLSEIHLEALSHIPTVMPIVGEQVTQEALYSIEDQRYRSALKLKNQPMACAYIKRLNEKPRALAIENVPDDDFDEKKVRNALEISNKSNPYYLSIRDSIQQIEERQKLIKDLAKEHDPDEEPAPKPKLSRLK